MTYTPGTAIVTPVKRLHGNNGSFCVTMPAGTKQLFSVTKLSFEYSIELARIDNSGTPGWRDQQYGQQMIDGSFAFVFDLANSPFISPQAILTPLCTYELNLNAVSTANAVTTLNTQLWTGPALIGKLAFAGYDPSGSQIVTASFGNAGVWTIPAV
jgi:hypothetical protein